MIKLLILEDEYIILQGVKSLVDWRKYDISIVGVAMDGLSGFDLIIKEKPDIVLTDIRMPGMDGLSIIEKSRYILPNTEFIIFSGYSDFEYARKAIALGVVDYIEKPVTVENIEKVLKRTVQSIKEKKLLIEMKEKIKLYKGEDIDNIFTTLLNGEELSQDIVEQVEKKHEINLLEISNFTVCVGQFNKPEKSFENSFKLAKGIFNNRLTSENTLCFVVKQNNQFIVILIGKSSNSLKGVNKTVLNCKTECKSQGIDFYIGIGNKYNDIIKLSDSYKEAKEALRYSLFDENINVVNYNQIPENKNISINMQEFEDSLADNLRSGNKKLVIEQVNDFMIKYIDYKISPDELNNVVLELIYVAIGIAREIGRDFMTENEEKFLPQLEASRCENYEELRKWVVDKFCCIIDWINLDKGQNNRKSILLVKEYIKLNYQKDLTLFEMSDIAKMTPTYFSSVFKEEIGTSYIKYLTKIRMEKAKLLLNKGFKVMEVSEMIGYHNYRYFCEIFKKHHGVTAQQFKGISK